MKNRLRLSIAALLSFLFAAPSALAHDITAYENVSVRLEHVKLGLRTRDILYLFPTHPTGPQLAPTLILLEYLRGTPVDMADLTEASRLVRDYGAWIILPASENGRWNYGPSSFAQTDDVGFLSDVIDSAIARYPIDPHRIYMGGYSNGAEMTQRYACEHPEKIAAGALIAGSIHNTDADVCHPGIGTPMVIFHGTLDNEIKYEGNLLYRSSVETAQLWAGFSGCSLQPLGSDLPDAADDGTTVHLDRYRSCTGHSGVDHYTFTNAGHTYPGSLSFSSALGITSQELSATVTLWQFVSQFSRP